MQEMKSETPEMKSETPEMKSDTPEDNQKTIVQNITYNIHDSAISGDISNSVNEKL